MQAGRVSSVWCVDRGGEIPYLLKLTLARGSRGETAVGAGARAGFEGIYGLYDERTLKTLREAGAGPAVRAGAPEHPGDERLRHALHALLLHGRAGRPAPQEVADEDARDRAHRADVGREPRRAHPCGRRAV